MTPDKTIILTYLQSHSDRKISVQEMLGKLQSEGFKMSRRGLRMVYEEMITMDGCLVGSSPHGLFYIRSKEQINEMVGFTKKTASSLFKKANCLIDNWNKANNDSIKQLELFEVDKSTMPLDISWDLKSAKDLFRA